MRNRGFTLIELMLVVVVVAILAAVAYPSYEAAVRKSRRADAREALTSLQQAQEKLRGSCRFYAQSIGGASACGADASATTVGGATTSSNGFYTLSVQGGSASGNSYVLEADPQGAQASDTSCDPMTLTVNAANPNGLRSPADCW